MENRVFIVLAQVSFSLMLTTNKPYFEWDRLLHMCNVAHYVQNVNKKYIKLFCENVPICKKRKECLETRKKEKSIKFFDFRQLKLTKYFNEIPKSYSV